MARQIQKGKTMSKITLYYSVEDHGDGSAYPQFFLDKDVAEWHQENLDQGWGEPCTGSITVEGDNLSCPEATSKEGYYLELMNGYERSKDKAKRFAEKFFPEGLPTFQAGRIDDKWYGIYVEGKQVGKKFSHPDPTSVEGMDKLASELNGLTEPA
jgi:hypothetical protein